MAIALTDKTYRFGSFFREDLAGTLLQKKLWDRGVFLSKSAALAVYRDDLVLALTKAGRISEDACEAYHAAARKHLLEDVDLTVGSNEMILRRFFKLRLDHFGPEPFQALWQEQGDPRPTDGLDQRALFAPYEARGTCFFYCSESAFLPDLIRDLRAAVTAGKRIVFLTGDERDPYLPPASLLADLWDGASVLSVPDTMGCMDFGKANLPPDLSSAIAKEDAVLLGYGEDALLACHDLSLPALVTVIPRGIPARAVIGLFTRQLTSRVFLPARFSILPTVSLVRRTELSFYQISILAAKYGEAVYRTPWEELARRDGGVFLNVYDDHLPPRLRTDFQFTGPSFGADRAAWCQRKLASLPGVRPLHGCFALPDFTPVSENWESREKREQILVDGVVAAPGTAVRVLPLPRPLSPRKLFFDRQETGSAVLSNFTFFFTGKLLSNYNERLAQRPRERIDFSVGTLDYYRYTDESGVRHETLPLYDKATLAASKDGFFAFDFALGGGRAELLPGLALSWTASQVNAPHPDLSVYTPLRSLPDEEREPKDYLLLVGEGRLNIAVVGEKILCARRGEVSLPCVGTVFSLNGPLADKAASLLGDPDENGYYDVSSLPAPIFRPDPPAGISRAVWDSLDWAYGGGLSLITEEGEITRENYMERFRQAGWLSPLSRQTQESRVHTLARHPRTAVGVTREGALFVLVVSGRSPISVGADYLELCRVARLIVPDLATLINWDGGGSSVLGLLEGDVFTELNYPAPSDGSVTGMARAVSSVLLIDPR